MYSNVKWYVWVRRSIDEYSNMANKKKHGFPKIPHKISVRDLVSVRDPKKLQDLLPAKRRDRLAKIYGYKA